MPRLSTLAALWPTERSARPSGLKQTRGGNRQVPAPYLNEGTDGVSEAIIGNQDKTRWKTPLHRPRLAFRRWRRTRPFWAGFWVLLGGILILYFPLTAIRLMFISGQVVWLAILVGVLIALCGLFLWIEPNLRRVISAVAVVLGVLSLVTSDIGGFIIGMLLTLVGGSMGLAWMPVKQKGRKETPPVLASAPDPHPLPGEVGGDAVEAGPV